MNAQQRESNSLATAAENVRLINLEQFQMNWRGKPQSYALV
jgi:hypothetical protein